MIGIGIDTGGTYTDAVAYNMQTKEILSYGKALTTKEALEIGIAGALDELDQEYVKQAKMLALSTTLATNACVENKGSRAKLLLIGVDKDFMEQSSETYAKYGFSDLSQLVVIDGKPEKIFKEAQDPDWDAFAKMIPATFGDCKSIGVVQMFPHANGGKFEKDARAILEKQLSVPITTAYDMFNEVDVLKRGAGTLLNARLIPLIAEFLRAVKKVMKDRDLDIPVAIVRSDGSLMAEAVAQESPVETLLSGPAASVVGGGNLAASKAAVIVDMGGTTTDIALIQDGAPVMAEKGISIGKWKTMVKGLYVDTFGLGGDSAVRYQGGKLFVDSQRVIPISLLASQYPVVLPKIKKLAVTGSAHTKWLHEFFVLQRRLSDLSGYTPAEKRICETLAQGPLLMQELADAIGVDLYALHTERLEEEGIVMRSGLTPTDMMVCKGDFDIYKADAALAAIHFLGKNVRISEAEMPDAVYDLVDKKMYCNIVRILMLQKYPKRRKLFKEKALQKFIELSFEDAKSGKPDELISTLITAGIPLVGVGAPIHIFLPRVAKLLKTQAIVPKQAAVANALGAIASQIMTRVEVSIKAEYDGLVLDGFSVFEGTRKHMFEKYEEAEPFALELAKKQVLEKARRHGATDNPEVSIKVVRLESEVNENMVLFESKVQAVAMGSFAL